MVRLVIFGADPVVLAAVPKEFDFVEFGTVGRQQVEGRPAAAQAAWQARTTWALWMEALSSTSTVGQSRYCTNSLTASTNRSAVSAPART